VPDFAGRWVSEPCRCRAPMPFDGSYRGDLVLDSVVVLGRAGVLRLCSGWIGKLLLLLLLPPFPLLHRYLVSATAVLLVAPAPTPYSTSFSILVGYVTPARPRNDVCLLFNLRGCLPLSCSCTCTASLLYLLLCPFCEALRCMNIVNR
jgi:hypothetical protein